MKIKNKYGSHESISLTASSCLVEQVANAYPVLKFSSPVGAI